MTVMTAAGTDLPTDRPLTVEDLDLRINFSSRLARYARVIWSSSLVPVSK